MNLYRVTALAENQQLEEPVKKKMTSGFIRKNFSLVDYVLSDF